MRLEGGKRAESSLIRLLLPAVQDAIGDLVKHLVRAGVADAERRLTTRLAGCPLAEGSDPLPLTDRRVRQAATKGARRKGLSKEASRMLGDVITGGLVGGLIRMQTAACNTNPNLSTMTCCFFYTVTFLPTSSDRQIDPHPPSSFNKHPLLSVMS